MVNLETFRPDKLYTAFPAVNSLHDPVVACVLLCGGFESLFETL